MDRKMFMNELNERLSRMSESDRREALSYYEEYFEEAGIENEEEVLKSLGTPSQVAKQIMADYAVKASTQAPRSARKGMNAGLLVILALLASPIALPLVIVVVVLAFVAVFLVGVFIFVGIVIVLAMGVSAIAGIIASVAVFTVSPASGVFFLGTGIAFLGVCILFGVLVYLLISRGMPFVVQGINTGLNKLQKRRKS